MASTNVQYMRDGVEGEGDGNIPMSATFYNVLPWVLSRYWDDGTPDGRFQGTMKPGDNVFVGTRLGHVFFFKRQGYTKVIARYTMNPSESMCAMLRIHRTKFLNTLATCARAQLRPGGLWALVPGGLGAWGAAP